MIAGRLRGARRAKFTPAQALQIVHLVNGELEHMPGPGEPIDLCLFRTDAEASALLDVVRANTRNEGREG